MRRAARGKRRRGDVAAFLRDAPARTASLADELDRRSYRPGAPRVFRITDPKPRTISALPFRDLVVQHALVARTLPSLERGMRERSFACREGKGTRRALALVAHHARTKRHVLQADVRKFFPSIDHALLVIGVRH